ncbi:MAG: hypothetical protein ACFFC7_17090 [Candidatus Hermodarchaeota archaeon]
MSSPRRTSARRKKTISDYRKGDSDIDIMRPQPKKPEEFRSGIAGFIDKFNAFSPATQMYYVKLTVGALFGFIVGNLPLNHPVGGWVIGLIIAVIALAIAAVFIRYGLKIPKDVLDDRRLILNGTFSFVMIFLVAWVVFWQLGNVNISLVQFILGI